MKSTLSWTVLWIAILGTGFWASQRLLAPPPLTIEASGEVAISVSAGGHYYIDGAINGVPLRFMVDTGATYVAVDAKFAQRAQLPGGVPGYFNTANGAVEGRIVRGQTVQAGPFEVEGLSIAVMPNAPGEGLLGQNFLRQFDVSQSAGVLRLRPRTSDAAR